MPRTLCSKAVESIRIAWRDQGVEEAVRVAINWERLGFRAEALLARAFRNLGEPT